MGGLEVGEMCEDVHLRVEVSYGTNWCFDIVACASSVLQIVKLLVFYGTRCFMECGNWIPPINENT